MNDDQDEGLPIGEGGETVEVRTGNDLKRRAVLVTPTEKKQEQAAIIADLEEWGLYDKEFSVLGQKVRVPFRRKKPQQRDPFSVTVKEKKA